MPRFHCPAVLQSGQPLTLPAGTARHVQVLRLQPGQSITLFNGEGGEWDATITRMGRSDVDVTVGTHTATECEPCRAVTLAMGMPANDRMDWLVEKAAELGAASVQPLHTAHSVLRLAGERAAKKQAHWQSVAVAACEQCGGNRVPAVHAVGDFAAWLKALPSAPEGTPSLRCLLSLAEGTQPLTQALAQAPALTFSDKDRLQEHWAATLPNPPSRRAAWAAGNPPWRRNTRSNRVSSSLSSVLTMSMTFLITCPVRS